MKIKRFLKVNGALIATWRRSAMDGSVFQVNFNDKVIVTKSFYPPIAISDLLASIGGALGLWLGVGILQILFNGLNYASICRTRCNHSRK